MSINKFYKIFSSTNRIFYCYYYYRLLSWGANTNFRGAVPPRRPPVATCLADVHMTLHDMMVEYDVI